jgi:hypothetical protein
MLGENCAPQSRHRTTNISFSAAREVLASASTLKVRRFATHA